MCVPGGPPGAGGPPCHRAASRAGMRLLGARRAHSVSAGWKRGVSCPPENDHHTASRTQQPRALSPCTQSQPRDQTLACRPSTLHAPAQRAPGAVPLFLETLRACGDSRLWPGHLHQVPTEERPCRGSRGQGPASQPPLPHLPQPGPSTPQGWVGAPGPRNPSSVGQEWPHAGPAPALTSLPATQQAPKSPLSLVPRPGTLLTHHHSF